MRYVISLALALALTLPSAAFSDEGNRLPVWQIDGEQNRVYLLGSIHLLREQDYPLPAAFDSVYADADTLIMELDMDDMDPVESQTLANEMGLIQDGRTLSSPNIRKIDLNPGNQDPFLGWKWSPNFYPLTDKRLPDREIIRQVI